MAALSHFGWAKKEGEEPVEKLGYAANFEPYKWMLGSGVYVDDWPMR